MTAQMIAAIVGVALTAAMIIVFVAIRKHPENAASHSDTSTRADATGRATLPGEVMERPAGPDAESQAVDPAGGAGGAGVPTDPGPPSGAGQTPEYGPSERRDLRRPER